ncbi:hypothetical protein PM10SUCC1_33880 [Propionigenium maris DSM 9537]|uniref:Periplasmic heavy metal sensor n=1 Tax=Propionigenium maris DSM 9537 TaxID=1123000 RepID=A0A9W6LPD1_9FUSO|nr:periplasmic heavy metal sensor [Propionigenium maris]GLI57874.1 hypothetical protein PM10SUCC1_33880 [Propionigenium maris DSM 9537]
MKKILAVTAVVLIASGAFAQGHPYQNKGTPGYGRGGGMGYHYESMTFEQQEEFTKLHDEYRVKMRRSMLDIKEVNLKIEREMMRDKPNKNTLNKLIDERARAQGEHQKEMLKYRLEMKEKFGVEMRGCGYGNWK